MRFFKNSFSGPEEYHWRINPEAKVNKNIMFEGPSSFRARRARRKVQKTTEKISYKEKKIGQLVQSIGKNLCKLIRLKSLGASAILEKWYSKYVFFRNIISSGRAMLKISLRMIYFPIHFLNIIFTNVISIIY